MKDRQPVLTTSITDTRRGPNEPSSAWVEDGRLHGGVQSVGRSSPCSFTMPALVDAMRRHADQVSVTDPWFFSERTARAHIASIRRDADALASGSLSIVAEQHEIGLSSVDRGLGLLNWEIVKAIDVPEAQRAWVRDNPDGGHG